MKKIIFITGHRKSGTTLMLSLFDNHPDVITFPLDLSFLYAFFPYYQNKKISSQTNRLKKIFNKKFNSNIFNENFGWDNSKKKKFIDNFLIEFRKIKKINRLNLTILFINYWLKFSRSKKKIIVIKETSQLQFYYSLLKNIPNCYVINMIRDPRDNFAALKSGLDKYYENIGEDYLTLLNSFIFKIRLEASVFEFHKKNRTKKIVFVKYESLVNNIKRTQKRVSKFLDIEYSSSLLVPSINGNPLSGNSFDNKNTAIISKRNINNWKKRLSEIEIKIINFLLNNEIQIYKYPSKFKLIDTKFIEDFYDLTNLKFFFKDSFKKNIYK